MKKILLAVVFVFTAIVLVACGEKVSLEWEKMPKSVYTVNEQIPNFREEVKVKIGGESYTLKSALEKYPKDFTIVSDIDLSSEGDKVFTVKFQSLTINWSYKVGAEQIQAVVPNTSWYSASESVFTLASIEDLYGFAALVNNPSGGVDFEGKTVKLGVDVDLSDKVWEPIGASPRKVNSVIAHTYNSDSFTFGTFTKTRAELDAIVEVHGAKFIDAYIFAEKTGETGDNYKFYKSEDEPTNPRGTFFKGTFDGQNHRITGLSDIGYTPFTTLVYANSVKIIRGYTFGLFGVATASEGLKVTFKNLVFEDVNIVGAYYDSETNSIVQAEIDSVGAIVGYVYGLGSFEIDNVKVLSGSISASNAAAGLVGRLYNEGAVLIQNSENHANIIIAAGGTHAAGFLGYAAKQKAIISFKNNINYGNIKSQHPTISYAGAMVDYLGNDAPTGQKHLFDNCRNYGNITGTIHTTGEGKGMTSRLVSVNRITYTNCINYGDLKLK